MNEQSDWLGFISQLWQIHQHVDEADTMVL